MGVIPKLMVLKDQAGITRKTPKFTQERRKMYANCPRVQMRFAYKHKLTGAIETVDCDATPAKKYHRNPEYIKIYEEAHVQVNFTYSPLQFQFVSPLIAPCCFIMTVHL